MQEFTLDNVKCSGCTAAIEKEVSNMQGARIESLTTDGKIVIDLDDSSLEEFKSRMDDIGYPVK